MKKKPLLLATGLTVIVLAAGCGNKSADVATTEAATELSTEAVEGITGYLVENASDFVTLGDLKDLEVEKPVYEVTDEEVGMEVESRLYDYAEVKEVDRPAQDGDTLTVSLAATVEGETEPTIDEEDYPIELGYQEFGPQFDEQLMGVKAGDEKTFSCSFEDDTFYEEWIGKTVNFVVRVTRVEETITPEYTEEFVKDTLGYDSIEAFEASVRETLQEDNERQSDSDAGNSALYAAMNDSEFNGYPDQLYDSCKQEVNENYDNMAEMFGMTREELLEAYGMTEDDIESEVLLNVNQKLFVSALCQQEHITVTDEEYNAYLEEQYSFYGYEDAESFEQDYGKEYILWALYTEKASAYLLENAKVTEVPASLVEDEEIEEGVDAEEIDGLEEGADTEETDGLEEGADTEETGLLPK